MKDIKLQWVLALSLLGLLMLQIAALIAHTAQSHADVMIGTIMIIIAAFLCVRNFAKSEKDHAPDDFPRGLVRLVFIAASLQILITVAAYFLSVDWLGFSFAPRLWITTGAVLLFLTYVTVVLFPDLVPFGNIPVKKEDLGTIAMKPQSLIGDLVFFVGLMYTIAFLGPKYPLWDLVLYASGFCILWDAKHHEKQIQNVVKYDPQSWPLVVRIAHACMVAALWLSCFTVVKHIITMQDPIDLLIAIPTVVFLGICLWVTKATSPGLATIKDI